MKQVYIILVSIMCGISYAQETQHNFSLQEAIDFAIQNNRTAKNAQRDIEMAKKQKWEATATGLPQINSSINYQNFLKQQVSVIPAEFFGGNAGEFAEVIFGTKQNASASASLEQLIFDGSYIVGLQSAKVFLEISKNAKEKTDLEVRKSTINAYGNVLLAEETITVFTNNIAVVEKNLKETTKIYENGLEEEESVEQLQITLTSLKSRLANAKRLNTIAYQMLNIVLGLEYNTTLKLTDTLEALTLQNIDLSALDSNNNINNTLDYKIALNNKVSEELLLKLQKSKALPRLSASLNGGYNTFSNDFIFLNQNTKWNAFSSFNLNINIPIFSSLGRSAATQRAKINVEKAEADLIETEQQLQLNITAAKSDYKFAIEDYDNKKQNLDLAQRIEQKNQTKFFEGLTSSFELRQAQSQLYNAQQEYLQAMLDVITKKAELETLTNTVD